MPKDIFKWTIMKEDGTIVDGEGTERMLIEVLKSGTIVDGDVTVNGYTKNIDFWRFLAE